ncbi:hypothetical protein BDB00DRAFT_845151 [Zychaea mexicana]|uniref:uncharacterized protein n=1 Tax=Zychaea mexicana TaxID=64656 RepID=UPI0022FDD2DD|nr:uncharacterized protein BDB00DRAFT_845151 [Zychaea mexicana]KAI9489095.1 hypothetical protein BDB00DRAFT_845151 [Zychaea mexicana]
MTVNSTSALVVEWSHAVQQVDLYRVQQLLDTNPDLLWTPLTWDPERDASHVITQLVVVQNLGPSLENLCAIPYTLIQYCEPSPGEVPSVAQVQTEDLLYFLIDQSSIHDFNRCMWGNCKNTTLHLVSFLGHTQVARRLVVDKGVPMDIPNDFGCIPRDVAQIDTMVHLLGGSNHQQQQQRDEKKQQRHMLNDEKAKPKYASADRFKQLKELAETSASKKNANNSTRQAEGRYFRAGHVAESKKKVLNDEEAELEKQRARRRAEVAQLAKRSAVKSNPLFRKFEQQQGVSKPRRAFVVKDQQQQQQSGGGNNGADSSATTITSSTDTVTAEQSPAADMQRQPSQDADSTVALEEEFEEGDETSARPKRNSKVISSLRNKTYVSASVFRQGDDTSPGARIKPSPSVSSCSMGRASSSDMSTDVDIKIKETKDTIVIPEPVSPVQDRRSLTINEIQVTQELEAENSDRRRLSGSQKAHWSIALNSWSSVLDGTIERNEPAASETSFGSDYHDSDDGDEWFDSQEDHIQHVRTKKSKASIKSTASVTKATNNASVQMPKAYYIGSLPDLPSESTDDQLVTTDANRQQEQEQQQRSASPPAASAVKHHDDVGSTAVRIISRSRTNTDASSSPSVLTDNSSTSTSTSSSSSSSSPSTVSPSSPVIMPPLAVIPEKNSKNDNSLLFDNNTSDDGNDHSNDFKPNYGSVSVRSTSRYVRRLSQAQNAYLKQQQQQQQLDRERKDSETVTSLLHHNSSSQQFKIKRVPVKLSPSQQQQQQQQQKQQERQPPPTGSISAVKKFPSLQDLQSSLPVHIMQRQPSSRYGKLYFRVSSISNVLLPLPREPTYVRCVVSDDRYEYMSRYEVLGQYVKFDYECIMDTYPDMIITISLHIRPDYHVRNKIPITRLFSTSRNRGRKGSLSGYIFQEDGSIGRARFALPHMIDSCYERPYATQFDCFNAWSARYHHHHHHHHKSQKNRGREDDLEGLKVIGNLEVEMLYLPVSDPSAVVPRNLRDCDMAIKVQQWNETFWNTEQLSNTTISASSPTSPSTATSNSQHFNSSILRS